MLIDVRQQHYYSGRCLLNSQEMYGCRDADVNWEFAFCQVMIAIGFVRGRASPCIHRHLEKQLRVLVHGDDFVPLGYIVNVKWFFVKLQEFWDVTSRGILGPPG